MALDFTKMFNVLNFTKQIEKRFNWNTKIRFSESGPAFVVDSLQKTSVYVNRKGVIPGHFEPLCSFSIEHWRTCAHFAIEQGMPGAGEIFALPVLLARRRIFFSVGLVENSSH